MDLSDNLFLGTILFLLPDILYPSSRVCFLLKFSSGNAFMLVMEPTELVCPSETFQNDTKRLALCLKGEGLSLRVVGLEVSSAFCLLYSKRSVITL